MQKKAKNNIYSEEHLSFLKKKSKKVWIVRISRIGFLVVFVVLWELLARFNIIDSFIVSSPSGVWRTFLSLNHTGELWKNVYFTACETIAGFLLGTVLGVIFAIIIWWSDLLRKIIEPFLVILNAVPKVALGPIIIVWIGAGMSSIIVMALLVSVIISTINILDGFKSVSPEKIFLMKSFGASKRQMLFKLVIPSSFSVIISALKINVGMSLIGVITGEFLVSSQGIGYLIVYGGQVFKMDLVMAGIFILGALACALYLIVAAVEAFYLRGRKST